MSKKIKVTFEIEVDNSAFRDSNVKNGIYMYGVMDSIAEHAERFKFKSLEEITGSKIRWAGNVAGIVRTEIQE